MVEDPANLVLEHIRAIQSDVLEMKDLQREQGHRLSRIELSVAGLRREQAGDAENAAYLGARLDKLSGEIDRIKRRLEIID